MVNAMGDWIPLMDYAMEKGVSLSTLRRHIKANKVEYRVENGRYLLFVESSSGALAPRSTPVTKPTPPSSSAQSGDYLFSQLQTKLQKAQKEIAELKTLIAFYEETLNLGKPTQSRFDV